MSTERTAIRAHAKDLRKGRVNEVSRVYHITTTTLAREPVFQDLYLARGLIQCLRQSDINGDTQTFAFVVMPDHLHWLVQLLRDDLPKIVGGVKSIFAHRVGRRIWQPSYYDHALRQEEDLRMVARYIITNPVRAGLVKSVKDYPHWDAIWM